MKEIFNKHYSELLNVWHELEIIDNLMYDGKTIQAYEKIKELKKHVANIERE